MNKNYFYRMVILMMTMLSVAFVSCSKGEEDDAANNDNNTTHNDPGSTAQDPEGTIVINMSTGSTGNFYDIGMGEAKIHIDSNNNFATEVVTNNEVYYDTQQYSSQWTRYDAEYWVEFASIGKVNGLGQISTCPETGWTKSIAIVPEYGYVARAMKKGHVDINRIKDFFLGNYTRLYVVSNNAEGGFTVKYQTPFEIPFTIDKTSVKLSHKKVTQSDYITTITYTTGTSETINITNWTKAIKVSEKPSWCYVRFPEEYNGGTVTISAGKNPDPQPRSGDIIISNSVCSQTIHVTQDVAPQEDEL